MLQISRLPQPVGRLDDEEQANPRPRRAAEAAAGQPGDGRGDWRTLTRGPAGTPLLLTLVNASSLFTGSIVIAYSQVQVSLVDSVRDF